jgi:hypothetical protein
MSKMASWRSGMTAAVMGVSIGAFALIQQDLKILVQSQITTPVMYVFGALGVALLGFISNLISKTIVDAISRTTWGKMRVLGNTYLEGYWLNKTTRLAGNEGNSKSFTVDGIMTIAHDAQTCEILPSVYRVPELAKEIGYSNSNSLVAQIKDNGDYVNFAEVNFNGGPRKLLAFGRFVTPVGEKVPQIYNGYVLIEGSDIVMQQTATRMNQNEVGKLRKEYGQDWMLRYLSGSKIGQQVAGGH